ncbi:39S ribosomal protein L55, mitochondrial-like isoform X2 [Mercenaria mercenaria]|uniref:39S ribosomal protein L55, mitochondrial-like isoform X2 n=1 Tax=Mercenaria mercenaria TaxID=6596 RepID=UPI00234EADAE|nr:39S ribosomal protein L55, mitochondrial-like isoform X2 [Mercenaria mercenaria]
MSKPFRQTTCSVCSQLPSIQNERYNSNRTSITRTKTAHYVRTYPTLLVLPDGSSITVRYEKPRRIIKLPVDLSTLTDQEKEARIMIFNPPKKTEVKEDIEDDFNVNEYTQMFRKKRK